MQADIGQLEHTATYKLFQHRATHQQPLQRTWCVAKVDAVVEPQDFVDDVAINCPLADCFFAQFWEKLVQYLSSACEQAVSMTALWDAFARLLSVR